MLLVVRAYIHSVNFISDLHIFFSNKKLQSILEYFFFTTIIIVEIPLCTSSKFFKQQQTR